jgi:DNA-binding response OmpR family regulator
MNQESGGRLVNKSVRDRGTVPTEATHADYTAKFSPMTTDSRPVAGGTAARILIVDHDPAITAIFRQTLTEVGHTIQSTLDCDANTIAGFAPHCVILNLNPLAGQPPFHLIDEIRYWLHQPVIAVSEACSEDVKVTAFERGVDDYVCVPLGLCEFAARIGALLRRANQSSRTRCLRIGSLLIDRGARTAALDEQDLDLTNKEFDILVYLAQNQGLVVSAESLLTQVWGAKYAHYQQTLRVHISNLRKKTRSASPLPDFIRSVPGNGYLMAFQ